MQGRFANHGRGGWRRLALICTLLVAVAVSLSAAGPWAGRAARRLAVSCGNTVTTSITLTSDLSCVGSDGLDVGANSITIDLNGHTIAGDGTHQGIFSQGHNGVAIKNGTVDHFDSGIFLQGGDGNTVKNVHATRNAFTGISLDNGTTNATLTGNYAAKNDAGGISLGIGDDGARLTGNVAAANAEVGFFFQGNENVVVVGNAALNNGHSGFDTNGGMRGNFTGNVANGNTFDGFTFTNCCQGAR